MSPSKIEWTEETWNPTTGCSKVSPGCAHCYAEALSNRYAGAPGWPAEFKPWTPDNAVENVVLHPERLEAPMRWKTPRRVFVDSMSDLFHEQMPDAFIDQVFAVMALTPQHTYQVLTKRPERMREYMGEGEERAVRWMAAAESFPAALERYLDSTYDEATDASEEYFCPPFPLPNVWLGVSAENQRWADERIPVLLDTPAAVRFVSAEPLLGPINLVDLDWTSEYLRRWEAFAAAPSNPDSARLAVALEIIATIKRDRKEAPAELNALTAYRTDGEDAISVPGDPHLDWVIVGGESGPHHRPFDHDWARSIVSQCSAAGVACFIKQLGGLRPGTALEDLPEDLRVREYPA